MGNTSSYLHSFTQCIRIKRHFATRQNRGRKTSQQLIDINYVNDNFLNSDNSDDDDGLRPQDEDDNNDEKIIFYKPKKKY